MSFLISYDDIAYLMYVAIDKKYRNKGFGSLVLRDLILRQVDTSILLCIERPSTEKEDIKARRKDFYLRNSFYETGCFIEDSGVEYEFLSSSKERVITENDLKKRYSCMTRNPLIKFIIKIHLIAISILLIKGVYNDSKKYNRRQRTHPTAHTVMLWR